MNTEKMPLAVYNDIFKEQDELYRAVAKTCGLSDCAFWILYTLWEADNPLTQSDVCTAVYQPKQTVHSALKKLTDGGYLRLAEGRDRRSKYLMLTPQGEILSTRTVGRVMPAEEEAMNTMTKEEQAQFLTLFRHYTAALRQYLPQCIETQEKHDENTAI